MDGDVTPCLRYRSALRYRWPAPFGILGALESGYPLRSLWRFFGPSPRTRSDLWFSDPLPHLAEIAFAARRIYGRKCLRPPQRATSWEAV